MKRRLKLLLLLTFFAVLIALIWQELPDYRGRPMVDVEVRNSSTRESIINAILQTSEVQIFPFLQHIRLFGGRLAGRIKVKSLTSNDGIFHIPEPFTRYGRRFISELAVSAPGYRSTATQDIWSEPDMKTNRLIITLDKLPPVQKP